MPDMDRLLVKPFSLGGYRSFGSSVQRFERFSKINLFIGQNNCGKSNVLLFLHNVHPGLVDLSKFKLEPIDKHIPSGAPFTVGTPRSLALDDKGDYREFLNEIIPLVGEQNLNNNISGSVLSACQFKAKQDNTADAWFDFNHQGELTLVDEGWLEAIDTLDDRCLSALWTCLTRSQGGGRKNNWLPQTVKALTPKFSPLNTVLVPAIRQVGAKGSSSDDFSGNGIIERLVKLQNPDVHSQNDRKKFESINTFLQTVTDNPTARIEIPHERDTILVHMDGKALPLSSLGTGIHEVLILAAAATILDNTVVCMEEPELHLNPLLQKKLVRYLYEFTTNQYFITTHSAALMDTPRAEVYHIQLVNGESIVERVTSDRHRSTVCEDLGYHPSDLLQANCVIWVEGPSDRIYINHWIKSEAPQYVEGTHYSIMFYGGRLASHLSGDDPDDSLDDFISLRRLNRRGVIVIDSDRANKGSRINDTKKRLKTEFDEGPGFTWITLGREIENYIPPDHVKEAISETKPSAKLCSAFGPFDNVLTIKTKRGKESQASKVAVARYLTKKYQPDLQVLDLGKQLRCLIRFIEKSNMANMKQ